MQSKGLMDQTNEQEKEQEPEIEILDFTKPDFIFKPNQHHEWRQQGPYLVCKSCEIEHASYIGMEVLLVGLDEEGKPILKKRSEF